MKEKIQRWLSGDNNRTTQAELYAHGLDCPYVNPVTDRDDRTAETRCEYARDCTLDCPLNWATQEKMVLTL